MQILAKVATLITMIGFFIKKAFFDGWDNLISLVVLNLGFLLVIAALFGALELLAISTLGGIVVIVVVIALYSFYLGAVSYQTKEYAWYTRPGFAHFWGAFRSLWRHSLLYTGLSLVIFALTVFVIPFYFSYNNFFGLVVSVFLFWLALLLVLALFYFYPLAVQMPQDKPLKSLRKSFILLVDNLGFTLFLALYKLFNLLVSILFATLIPGVGGLQLSGQIALKLLLFKYDYLEENPEANRKKIPWEALLFDEREKVGPRSFKGMIFPWKE